MLWTASWISTNCHRGTSETVKKLRCFGGAANDAIGTKRTDRAGGMTPFIEAERKCLAHRQTGAINSERRITIGGADHLALPSFLPKKSIAISAAIMAAIATAVPQIP